MEIEYLFYALLIGIIPALLWLWVWLHEDTEHPEPKLMLAISFVAGMFVAPIAVIMQMSIEKIIPVSGFVFIGTFIGWNIIAWVVVEEALKFGASYFALKSKAFNEPVDAMIYLITAALGFVAVENTLFAFNNVLDGGINGLISGGLSRMIGPSLLHVVSSGTVGLAISLSFFKPKQTKILSIYAGLAIAVILHAIYNMLIITQIQKMALIAFGSVWVLAIILTAGFHIIKKIRKIPQKIIQ